MRRATRNRKAAIFFLGWAQRNKYSKTNCTRQLTRVIVAFVLVCWHEAESKELVSDLLQNLQIHYTAERAEFGSTLAPLSKMVSKRNSPARRQPPIGLRYWRWLGELSSRSAGGSV